MWATLLKGIILSCSYGYTSLVNHSGALGAFKDLFFHRGLLRGNTDTDHEWISALLWVGRQKTQLSMQVSAVLFPITLRDKGSGTLCITLSSATYNAQHSIWPPHYLYHWAQSTVFLCLLYSHMSLLFVLWIFSFNRLQLSPVITEKEILSRRYIFWKFSTTEW